MIIWHPDFCVGPSRCAIEITRAWSVIQFLELCSHHRGLRDGGLTDEQLFAAILQSSRVKEVARWAIKQHLGLDKEHPGVPYLVLGDGSISIRPGLTGQARTAARTVAATAIATVSRPQGTSLVTVD